MAKKIINDMLIPQKSIRQIQIASEKKHHSNKGVERASEILELSSNNSRNNINWKRKPLNPKFAIWLIAFICLLALFFGISILFSSATIIITPRDEKIVFNNDQYTAKLNSNGINELSFEVLNVKQTTGEIIKATEEKDVNLKASGNIIIYNNYSTSPQRLINNTRFEANNGKIYRINSSVIVPGLQKVDGKVIPGSIEATVFADQAGEEFNLQLTDLNGDFKIPGFKGDPRYDSFYARLKTDILGGLIGKQRIINDDLRQATEEILKTKLKEQLLKELYAIKPENYLILKDGYSIDYIKQPDTPIDSDTVKINMEGNLNGIVFNNEKLSKYLSNKKIEDFDNLSTEFIPSDTLVSTFIASDNTGLWKNNTLQIKFNGEATIKWLYDSEQIKKDFAGKSETDLKNLMIKYKTSVKSIRIMFRPVWTRYVPDDKNKIYIKEETGA